MQQQYNCGRASLAPASRSLLETLGLPHSKKHQWLISIKVAHQRQRSAKAARIAMAQYQLMEQLFIMGNQPTQNLNWMVVSIPAGPLGDQVIPSQE